MCARATSINSRARRSGDNRAVSALASTRRAWPASPSSIATLTSWSMTFVGRTRCCNRSGQLRCCGSDARSRTPMQTCTKASRYSLMRYLSLSAHPHIGWRLLSFLRSWRDYGGNILSGATDTDFTSVSSQGSIVGTSAA